MKHFFISLSLLCTVLLKAQSIDIEMGLGSGQSYLFEHTDETIDINYGLSANFYTAVVFRHPDSYFDINATILNTATSLEGTDWNTGLDLDGEVNTFSIFLALEHIAKYKVLDLGYAFGFGYNHESNSANAFLPDNEEYQYTSIKLAAILRKRLNDKVAINLRPILLWSDPYHSFSKSNWVIGREDLSVLINLGVSYKFPLSTKSM